MRVRAGGREGEVAEGVRAGMGLPSGDGLDEIGAERRSRRIGTGRAGERGGGEGEGGRGEGGKGETAEECRSFR